MTRSVFNLDRHRRHFGDALGAILKKKAEEKGMSQKEIARLMGVGPGIVGRIFMGRGTTSAYELGSICNVLFLNPTEVLEMASEQASKRGD
jgi:transcriptional regulator with XRE-family HTH domain